MRIRQSIPTMAALFASGLLLGFPLASTALAYENRGVTTVETLSVDGKQRSFRLHVPSSYQVSQSVPLVIRLHGFTSNGFQEEQISQFSQKADVEGFVVVYPEGTGNPQRWYFGPLEYGQKDVNFIRAIISTLENRYAIDPHRIYANGISNGAEMSYRLACDLADQIAAFGFVSGAYIPFTGCHPVRPVPIVVFSSVKAMRVSCFTPFWARATVGPAR